MPEKLKLKLRLFPLELEFSMSWNGFGLPEVPSRGRSQVCNSCTEPGGVLSLQPNMQNKLEKMRYACNLHLLTEVFISFFFSFFLFMQLQLLQLQLGCLPYAGHAPFWHMPRVARASYLDTRCNQHYLPSSINSSIFGPFFCGLLRLSQSSSEYDGFTPVPLPKFRPHLREELS